MADHETSQRQPQSAAIRVKSAFPTEGAPSGGMKG